MRTHSTSGTYDLARKAEKDTLNLLTNDEQGIDNITKSNENLPAKRVIRIPSRLQSTSEEEHYTNKPKVIKKIKSNPKVYTDETKVNNKVENDVSRSLVNNEQRLLDITNKKEYYSAKNTRKRKVRSRISSSSDEEYSTKRLKDNNLHDDLQKPNSPLSDFNIQSDNELQREDSNPLNYGDFFDEEIGRAASSESIINNNIKQSAVKPVVRRNVKTNIRLPVFSREDIIINTINNISTDNQHHDEHHTNCCQSRNSIIGGKDIHKSIRQVLSLHSTDVFCVELSWTGQKRTIGVGKMKFIEIITESLREKYGDCTAYEIQTIVQSWLQHARDRLKKANAGD
ncbi:uncharacterized protein [Chelonus insularis]|uniref:uncharacterized protein n=1 Tax=Chelonus insularis TaxID=460826 RepID=UPI00158DBF2F|nr:uncharacterized protein LOC118065479 [Chelonus insularis]